MAAQPNRGSRGSPSVSTWSPQTAERCDAIREQLGRILASSVFRNSKHYSSLLEYAVQRALQGKAEDLKERTIGVVVFGRVANYDTNADHVVRSAAGEVRKRLAQYYMAAGNDVPIRIDIPVGSYIPHFRFLVAGAPQEPIRADAALPIGEDTAPAPSRSSRTRHRIIPILAIAAVAALVPLGMVTRSLQNAPGTLDRFWRPILSSSTPVLLSIGNWDQLEVATQQAGSEFTAPSQPMTVYAFHKQESQKVFLDDAITLARLVGLLQRKGTPYRILSHEVTTFSDLQKAPAILIGFRSNYWTRRLLDESPFAVETENTVGVRTIRDKKPLPRRSWSVDLSTPYLEFARDYAIILRMRDPETEQMVVAAAGMTCFGTLAAGEFLTDPNQIKKLEAVAPRGWENKNIAIVLSTDIIKASAGPPNIVGAEFW
jgi:hypothetical protein